jgi:hypothetical protein
MNQRLTRNFWMRMTILASIAGLLYSSWPLGYILNPVVSRSGLASALEAVHQPYNWVFISGDVVSSLIMILICWLISLRLKGHGSRGFLVFVLTNIVIFAFGTIMDTLLPEHCLPENVSCPSWHVDHLLLAHGIFSILASLCLFFGLFVMWWENKTVLFYLLMVGYMIFGLWSLVEALSPTRGNFSQHYYITLCSVAMALVPYGIYRTFFLSQSALSKKSKPSNSLGKNPSG